MSTSSIQMAPLPTSFQFEYGDLFPKNLTSLLIELNQRFGPQRMALLAQRKDRQRSYDLGQVPSFLAQNTEATQGQWKVAPIPTALLKRRVEITGPVNSAKMVINMLSPNEQGFIADTAMLDFEDSMKPSWPNVLDGFNNAVGAAHGNLKLETPQKTYQLNPKRMAYPMVRVRGLHLSETNVRINNESISAGLFDLAVCFFHTARIYHARGDVAKFYIPKCEHHLEARWWDEVFQFLEQKLDVPLGTLRCTFLIETLPASFQMEEILFETKNHITALNVGRWDKIFSDIKTLKCHKERIMADRASITMNTPWMEQYAKRVIDLCHKRGAYAMGGMAAFTPGKEEALRIEQTNKVKADKEREYAWGHDGCWVSHPYFIGPALSCFKTDHQSSKRIENFNLLGNLLPQSIGPKTLQGLRTNIRVGIAYQQGWNQDIGCVAWDNLMEDLATLEISRAQVWQWLHHQVLLDSGEKVTRDLVAKLFQEELNKILQESTFNAAQEKSFREAANMAESIFTEKELREFLSLQSDQYTN
jgi:malate synthase